MRKGAGKIGEGGQASTEYLLMLAVALIVVTVFIYWIFYSHRTCSCQPGHPCGKREIANRLENIESALSQWDG